MTEIITVSGKDLGECTDYEFEVLLEYIANNSYDCVLAYQIFREPLSKLKKLCETTISEHGGKKE